MSNFDFIKADWPAIHGDCVRAESYLSTDPAAACFYSRRAIEQLVGHLYDVLALRGAVPERPGSPDQRRRLQGARSASGSPRSST